MTLVDRARKKKNIVTTGAIVSTDDMSILKTMLLTWSDDQVNKAWAMIAEEGKRRKVERTARIKQRLQPGDKVTFTGNKTGHVTGTVVRTKYKKAIVEVAGQNWDVPFHMLTKVA